VNQTNDAWFGRTGASSQHMSHLALRAVENRMACARAANTGVSGFVLPDGSMTQLIGLFKTGVQTRSLPLLKMDTFYTRRGDVVGPWGLAVCLAAALLVWGVGRFRNKEARDV
jgi:apolipoprotein N-acyltransferase